MLYFPSLVAITLFILLAGDKLCVCVYGVCGSGSKGACSPPSLGLVRPVPLHDSPKPDKGAEDRNTHTGTHTRGWN
jgi:hypothetical protein